MPIAVDYHTSVTCDEYLCKSKGSTNRCLTIWPSLNWSPPPPALLGQLGSRWRPYFVCRCVLSRQVLRMAKGVEHAIGKGNDPRIQAGGSGRRRITAVLAPLVSN